MKVYERICLKNHSVEAENGDCQKYERGRTYTMTAPRDGDESVVVLSTFWVRLSKEIVADIFEPFRPEIQKV